MDCHKHLQCAICYETSYPKDKDGYSLGIVIGKEIPGVKDFSRKLEIYLDSLLKKVLAVSPVWRKTFFKGIVPERERPTLKKSKWSWILEAL